VVKIGGRKDVGCSTSVGLEAKEGEKLCGGSAGQLRREIADNSNKNKARLCQVEQSLDFASVQPESLC